MKKSFTLIEILVVATIIGLLTAIGSTSYAQFNKQSRDARRKADLENIRAALEMYRSNNSYYVQTLNTLTSATDKYLNSVPTDPLGTSQGYSYQYTPTPAGCTTACTDYTLGALLEISSAVSCLTGCKTGVGCNYCVGPYGEK